MGQKTAARVSCIKEKKKLLRNFLVPKKEHYKHNKWGKKLLTKCHASKKRKTADKVSCLKKKRRRIKEHC